jgi:hypothetical protein
VLEQSQAQALFIFLKKSKGTYIRPLIWHPSVEISSLERNIINRIKRAKLFVASIVLTVMSSLMMHAQEELAGLYATSVSVGSLPFRQRNEPGPPLYRSIQESGDDEVIEATLMDRSFQARAGLSGPRASPIRASERLSPSARASLTLKWIDDSSSGRSSPARPKPGGEDHGNYVLHWTVVRYGELDVSSTRPI